MPVRTSSPLDMSDVREILNVHAEVLTFESSKRSEIESNGAEVKETTKCRIVVSVRFSLYPAAASETDDSDSDDSFPEPVSDDDLYSSDEEIDKIPENATQPPKRLKRVTLPDVFSETRDVRIARTGDGLDKLPWGNIKSHLTKTFPEGYYITLCFKPNRSSSGRAQTRNYTKTHGISNKYSFMSLFASSSQMSSKSVFGSLMESFDGLFERFSSVEEEKVEV
ncbi:hypothetical protein KQX54_012014 [Cotesia glomerata]|uniref:Uncharacterized protein n=1 Tax=Cotesia glomerata TaxID=32391 RepID=A0AAV7HTR2_COTGL|nr:hypothetical protein KQX54_012014 [Cotesia glomerata]